MTAETETGTENFERTLSTASPRTLTLFGRIGSLFSGRSQAALLVPQPEPERLSESVRVAWQHVPFVLKLGNLGLEFHPDLTITGDERDREREWIVHAGSEYHDAVPKFMTIRQGETVLLGRCDNLQTQLFGFDGSVADRHVKVSNHKGELTILVLEPDRSTTVSSNASLTGNWVTRRSNLLRLQNVLEHALVEFDAEEALQAIGDVNGIMATEAYRDLNEEEAPGGVIRFPDSMTVVVMGDVHARAENLLRVICEGGFLAALERNEVCLVLLGDLVHSQERAELEDMSSTVFTLDLFCLLKRRFPAGVFYIHGNHESFSPEVGKGGVPQGVLLRKHLAERRGNAYVDEVEKLFDSLAYVVQGKGFAACHGAPVRSRVTLDSLINIHKYPGIQSELVWNRLRQGNRPAGYGKGSVKRFRKTLGLPKQAHFFVGHTPLSPDETLWLDAGGIPGHHVIYAAHTHRLAAVVMSGGQMTPLEFVPEASLAFFHDQENTLS